MFDYNNLEYLSINMKQIVLNLVFFLLKKVGAVVIARRYKYLRTAKSELHTPNILHKTTKI